MRKLHHSQRNRCQADKIKAVILLGTGWTVVKVAEALFQPAEGAYNSVERERHDHAANQFGNRTAGVLCRCGG